ncbi:MAG TPA: glycosyltransferase family 2 protein [Longimicrobiaceae bacterium]
MKPPRVSVVIPTWNGEKLLPMVLDSLRTQRYRDFDTVVVDNGSEDGSVELLAREYPEVRVVALPENLGFSVAVNAGIRAGDGELVALVNNDVELDPEWLAEMVAALDRDPRAGSATARIRQFRARHLLDSAGDRIIGVPAGRGYGATDGPEFDRVEYIASPCAAAALYRREMLDEIGLFNEDFFAYYEDVELGMRAQIAGYRCVYVPTAIAYHLGSETSKRISKRTAFYRLRNLVQLYLTTLPPGYALRSLPVLAIPVVEFGVRGGGLGTCVRVGWVTLRRLPAIARRRREIFARRRISDAELREILEPAPSVLRWAAGQLSGRRVRSGSAPPANVAC